MCMCLWKIYSAILRVGNLFYFLEIQMGSCYSFILQLVFLLSSIFFFNLLKYH